MGLHVAENTPVVFEDNTATRTLALTVYFDWLPIGLVLLDACARLDFPRAPSAPGVYQFELTQNGSSSFYIGQADNVARRLQHYRTPGPSQQTNIRLNRLMTDTLVAGGQITLSIIAPDATIDVRGRGRLINLSAKFERVLLEHAAISDVNASGIKNLNR